MDDFDLRPRSGESRDKGKGKAPATQPDRHSVSGRPGALHIDDVSYAELTSLLCFSLYGALTSLIAGHGRLRLTTPTWGVLGQGEGSYDTARPPWRI